MIRKAPIYALNLKLKIIKKTSTRNNSVSFSLVVGAFHPPPFFFNVAKCAAWHPEFDCSKLKCFHRSLDFFLLLNSKQQRDFIKKFNASWFSRSVLKRNRPQIGVCSKSIYSYGYVRLFDAVRCMVLNINSIFVLTHIQKYLMICYFSWYLIACAESWFWY